MQITCTDQQRLTNIDFDRYQSLGAYSFSFLKREQFGVVQEIELTEKILLGSLVDDIITGGKVNMLHHLYPAAKTIAAYLNANFSTLLNYMHSQVSYTGIMHYQGFSLPIRGRLDKELKKRTVLDLKVTDAKNIPELIKFMKYDSQLFGYAKLGEHNDAYILAYSKPLKKALLYEVPIGDYDEFWAEKILKFGTVCDT